MKSRRVVVVALAMMSMAHVGSPDTFFGGKAGPYDVRVSVRLPGVIPGRAQVTIRGFRARDTSQKMGMLRELVMADGTVYGMFGPQQGPGAK